MTETIRKNTNSGVDRGMLILSELERNPAGLSLDALSEVTGVTRSTTYRILNSFEASRMVRSLKGGTYVLGSRVLQLAASLGDFLMDIDYPRICKPHLESAARKTGETAKISIHDRGVVFVVAGAIGHNDSALTTVVGRYQPLHAGAASKVLLSTYTEAQLLDFFAAELPQFTENTMVRADELRAEITQIRSQKWAFDRGEISKNINAYGAPILDHNGAVVAALSMPFVTGRPQSHLDLVHETVIETAEEISKTLKRMT